MARLIDGDALITWIKGSQQMTSKMKSIICYIKTMPTIDAVETVRCKNCKHGKYEFTDNKDWIYCKYHYDYWTANDYCSYGERREKK